MKTVAKVLNSSKRHWVGDGFYVSSMFNYASPGLEVSPFLLLDYAVPHEYPADGKPRGVGAHPHKGFETVTLAFQGEVAHKDSTGGSGVVGPGDVQWMTAGSGLLHEEMHSSDFANSGGTFEMVQLWVNLPARFKTEKPRYQTLTKSKIPVVDLPSGLGSVRVIAGEFEGVKGSAETFTPIHLWDIALRSGAELQLPTEEGFNCMLLDLTGETLVSGQKLQSGELAVFENNGEGITIETQSDSRLLFLSGDPIDEPVVGHGPFVMNTEDEIHEAMQQFRNGAFG